MFTFENTDTLEVDLYFEHAKYLFDSLSDSYISESNEEQKEGLFKKIITAIKRAFEAAINKITEIFTGKKLDASMKKLDAMCQVDPSLKNRKITISNYKDLNKLSNDTLNELKKANCDVASTMEDYKKKRKSLLKKIGAGVGAATIALGVGIFLKKFSGSGTNAVKDTKKTMKALEDDVLKTAGVATSSEHGRAVFKTTGVATSSEHGKAVLQVSEDAVHDKVAEAKEIAQKIAELEAEIARINKNLHRTDGREQYYRDKIRDNIMTNTDNADYNLLQNKRKGLTNKAAAKQKELDELKARKKHN